VGATDKLEVVVVEEVVDDCAVVLPVCVTVEFRTLEFVLVPLDTDTAAVVDEAASVMGMPTVIVVWMRWPFVTMIVTPEENEVDT
jgi:hypothetical protein